MNKFRLLVSNYLVITSILATLSLPVAISKIDFGSAMLFAVGTSETTVDDDDEHIIIKNH